MSSYALRGLSFSDTTHSRICLRQGSPTKTAQDPEMLASMWPLHQKVCPHLFYIIGLLHSKSQQKNCVFTLWEISFTKKELIFPLHLKASSGNCLRKDRDPLLSPNPPVRTLIYGLSRCYTWYDPWRRNDILLFAEIQYYKTKLCSFYCCNQTEEWHNLLILNLYGLDICSILTYTKTLLPQYGVP